MVEYTSDICRVNSSNLFRPNICLSGGNGRRAKLRI